MARSKDFTGLLLVAGLFWLISKRPSTKSASASDLDRIIIQQAQRNGFTPQASEYIAAQARHETANYTSELFRELNNVFGMKLPRVRPTKAKPSGVTSEGSEAARFNSIRDAVDDLSLWFDYNRLGKAYRSIDAYVSALKQKRYFEAPYMLYLLAMKGRQNQLYQDNT